MHEHALFLLHKILLKSGAKIINLGAEKNPVDIVKAAQQQSANAIIISTHNGMALEYSRKLKEHLEKNRDSTPVIVGGKINQKTEGHTMPINVEEDIKKLGFTPCPEINSLFKLL